MNASERKEKKWNEKKRRRMYSSFLANLLLQPFSFTNTRLDISDSHTSTNTCVLKLVHGTKNVMISNAPRLVLFGSSNRERERILLDCILSNERANEKVKTWTARNWSHTILCCVDVSVVAGSSYLLFSGVFLLIILLLYQWMCMLRVIFGFSANFIQMFFLSFFFRSSV